MYRDRVREEIFYAFETTRAVCRRSSLFFSLAVPLEVVLHLSPAPQGHLYAPWGRICRRHIYDPAAAAAAAAPAQTDTSASRHWASKGRGGVEQDWNMEG